MIRWLKRFWYSHQRHIDLQILWPSCVNYADSLDKAKAAFAVHAFNDPAWLVLGEEEIYRVIDGL